MRAPHELVGSAEYLRELDQEIRQKGFPNPDPDLIERLTEARHVADEAEAAGADDFAEQVRSIREGPFEALRRFGYVMQGKETEGDHPSREEALEQLRPRERTFLDFPGPPPQFVSAAEDRGRADFEDDLPDADVDGDDERHATCARERRTVAAVVAGAAVLGEEFFEETGGEGTPSGVEYESAEEFGAVVAFNSGIVADGMLESGRGPVGRGPGGDQTPGQGGPPGGPMGPGGGGPGGGGGPPGGPGGPGGPPGQ